MGETSYRLGKTVTVSLSTSTAATSQLFTNGAGSRTFRLWSDVDCFVKVGESPSATTSDVPLTGKIADYVDLGPDEDVAGIVSSSTGTLYVTYCSKG